MGNNLTVTFLVLHLDNIYQERLFSLAGFDFYMKYSVVIRQILYIKMEQKGFSQFSLLLFYFQDEFKERPAIGQALNSISNYSSTIQNAPDDPNQKVPEKANLGTLMGVYLPCIQNIFGVILFIRMTWIVGTCGVVEGFLVILVCCTTVS